MTNKEISREKSYHELEGNILSYHSMRECIDVQTMKFSFMNIFEVCLCPN